MISAQSPFIDESLLQDLQQGIDLFLNILQVTKDYSLIGCEKDGTILLWNAGAKEFYGYEPEEVIGKHVSLIFTPEDQKANKWQELMEIAVRQGKWEGEINRRCKNGEIFTAYNVITPRYDTNKTLIGFLTISKNISKEIRMSEELQATQLYTRSLIESSMDALMITDPLGIVTDVNLQAETLLGKPRAELIGRPFRDFFTDSSRVAEAIKLTLKEGKVENYELLATQGGREIVLSYNATLFKNSVGKLQGIFAAIRDITEQKKTENQLRESQSYNRTLIESSADGLLIINMEGKIFDVNEQMCQMSGYRRQELIEGSITDYFDDKQEAAELVKEVFKNHVVKNRVLTLVISDNKQLKVSCSASIFYNLSRQVGGALFSVRDITEQIELQNKLDEERIYNRGLIESSADGFFTVDPLLIITDANAQMCLMTGYSREELIGSNFPDYFTDSKKAAEGIRTTLDRGGVSNYQLELVTKGGKKSLVAINAATFKDRSNNIRGIFATTRDVAEHAQLLAQLAEERAYNRAFIESSVDGLAAVNDKMEITDVNETMCRLLGYPRAHLIGSSFHFYFSDPQKAEHAIHHAFHEGPVLNYALALKGPSGKEIPISLNAAIFKDTAQVIKGVLVSARNVSEQKQLEEKLLSSQFYTRSLIESHSQALLIIDLLGVIADVNAHMENLIGYSRHELIGSPLKNCFVDAKKIEDVTKTILQNGKVVNCELDLKSKSGQETTMSINGSTFNSREGKLQGIFLVLHDVTEQKKLEKRLREQQLYLRELIESFVDGLAVIALDGTISDVNEKLCQMFGYLREELLGTNGSIYFTEPEKALAGVSLAFEQGFVTDYPLTLMSKSGKLTDVSFNGSVFKDPSGRVKGMFASVHDVTEKTKLQEELQEQKTYLRGLIESSVDGLITVDAEGFITDVNEQMCHMTGFEREELIGSVFKNYFIDSDKADWTVKTAFAKGSITNYELTLKSKSGFKSTVSLNASVFHSEEGGLRLIFASIRDVSEQTRLQKQLVDQKTYNRSLIEASPDALFAIAPDGLIVDVNEEAMRMTGYTRKHLINSAFSSYFTDPEKASEGAQSAFEKKKVLNYELTMVTRSGRRLQVSINAGVFTDNEGSPLGILAIARDVSAQKELEAKLRGSQTYTRSLIESNVDALMTTDLLGVITDVNEQMERLTGYQRKDLIGSAFKLYFTEPEQAENGIRLALQSGKVTDYELTIHSKEGKETVISYNAATFYDHNQKLQGVLATARDISELKRYAQTLKDKNIELEKIDKKREESELALQKLNEELESRIQERTQQLELANKELESFSYSISHDLRAPLRAIDGFSTLLYEKAFNQLSEEGKHFLTLIQKGAKDMGTLIEDLLTFSRSTRVPVKKEHIHTKDLLIQVLQQLEGEKGDRDVEISLGELPDCEADRHLLSQVFFNLLSNAFKFTSKKEKALITIGSFEKEGKNVFFVKDNGVGFDMKYVQKLFAVFQRLHSVEEFKGTGVGLAIVKRIIDRHGGSIWAEGEVDKGATFYFYI